MAMDLTLENITLSNVKKIKELQYKQLITSTFIYILFQMARNPIKEG